ncbi:MAG: DNA recombination protein RmuC [Dermatophilaceae bacterium]
MTVLIALLGLSCGALLAWLALSARYAARLAAADAERALLRERVGDLQASRSADSETAAVIAPLRESLVRVERQVHELERDRGEQFSSVASELARVQSSTQGLRDQTASLVGSLSSSSVRGLWGEVQLQRVLEHAGLLSRCDVDTQVSGHNDQGARVRPDAVVHLPGDKHLVIDAKAPMTQFLAAQSDGISAEARDQRMRGHATALRAHVDALAERRYWTAMAASPEMVVCFLPGEAFLGAALAADPELHEHAMRRGVVLASPATLLALLRTVAYTWRQEALTAGARELLDLGRQLYERLGALGRHTSKLGGTLQRSVEAYNALVGSLEGRVLVTTRRMADLGLAADPVAAPQVVTAAPRPLTALELIDALDQDVARPEVAEPADDPDRDEAGSARRVG